MVGQDRSKGCVFRDPNLGESQKVPPISLGGLSSRVYVPSLRPGKVFTKIMKPVVALLRRTGIRLIVYLDDILFMNSSEVGLQQDMITAQYLLEHLGFVINVEKSCFQPTPQLEFLGFVVNTLDMTLLLPDCKVEAIKSHCSKLLLHHEVSVRELSQLIGKLTASIQAVFPAPLHYRHLQNLKHKALARFGHFDATIALSVEAKDKLRWWLAHLNAWNGRALLRPSPDVIIETDASRTGWGAVCQGVTTGGLWSQMEQKLHINCLELLAGCFAVKSFTKDRLCVHVRLRMDNVSAVAYINRLGGTRSLILSNLALALWDWALKRNIFLSAEHLSGALNVSADWESRHFLDSSDWKLCPAIFRSLMQVRGPCALDLFANRLNAQLTQFYSWRPDPMALATDALLQSWAVGRLYAFPPFCLIMRCLAKLREEKGELILVTPLWPTQAWYPSLLEMSVSLPILLPWDPKLLQGPQGQSHPLVMNQTLHLAAWHVCNFHSKGFSSNASKLILAAWRPGTNSVYNSAWKKWHCWCIARKIDPLCPSLADITGFLAHSFDEGLEYRTINTYRSALSGVLPPMEGFPVGQHPLVVRLLKGILNLRPAMPRYQQSWDVNVALDYVRSLPCNQDLSLKVLTQKLALLLALTAPKRSSELKLLDLRFMRILPEGVVFELPGMTKTSSEVTPAFFAKFDDCESLCVLRCLQSYISRTRTFRPTVDAASNQQLLISYHKPVKSCSIARWIKSFLSSAGIDTSLFKGHSTRSASTSKAKVSGVSLEDVLKMADWAGPSSFLRFYYRPAFSDDYARAVLQ